MLQKTEGFPQHLGEVIVSAGIAKGRKIKIPDGRSVRPPRNIVRQAVFNIIGKDVEGRKVLDLFAGSGSFGIEALSRGAKKALFVEKSRETAKSLESNLEITGFSSISSVRVEDSASFLKNLPLEASLSGFGLIFADPPYAMSGEPGFKEFSDALKEAAGAFAQDAIVVLHVEADKADPGLFDALPGRVDLRKYGRNLLCFCYLP